MERKLTYFWEDKKYNQSSTRLMSFFVFLEWVRFNEVAMHLKDFSINNYWFAFMQVLFLIAIFTPKYLHKIAELKFKPTDTNP